MADRRITQLPLEVDISDPASLRRLTQIVLEVDIFDPAIVFKQDPQQYQPAWSPSFITPPLAGEATLRASFFGAFASVIELGQRKQWLKVLRR